MKRTLFALMMVLVLLTATACAGSSSSAPEGSAPAESAPADSEAAAPESADAASTEGMKNLEVWYANLDANTEKIVMDLAASMAGDGVNCVAQVIPTESFRTKIKVVMGSGGAPDVFVGWGGGATEQFIMEGQLYDLTDDVQEWKDQIYAASWDEATFDGRIYMVPYNVHGSMFYYNKTIFDRLGLAVPNTYDELKVVAQTLIDNDIIPFALGNSPKWPGAIYHSDLVLRIGGKEAALNALNNEGDAFMDEAFLKANQMVLDEVAAGWYPEGCNGINYETGGSRSLFYDGLAGMMVVNGNFAPNAKVEAPEFYENDLAIMPFPTVEGGKGNDAIICGIEALSITSKCENKDAALEYIRRFATDPEIVDRRANEGGVMVTYTGVKYEEQMRQDMWDYLTGATYVNNYIADMLPADLGNLYWDLTQALFGGLITAEDCSRQLQDFADQSTPQA